MNLPGFSIVHSMDNCPLGVKENLPSTIKRIFDGKMKEFLH